MKQISLASTGLERSSKRTRKREFLDEMNLVVPWAELVTLIAPHATAAKTGRLPFPVETMLHIHFLQQWFNLYDPAMEEALYYVPLLQQFVGLDLGNSRLPDESTILRFRHLLEEHQLSQQILAKVNATLQANGLLLRSGTVVEATLIAAHSSTKNSSGERDPEMHQTRKSNQWHFGIDADSDGSHGREHSGQRQRCHAGPPLDLRSGVGCLCRCRLPRRRQARGDSAHQGQLAPCGQASARRWTWATPWERCSTSWNRSKLVSVPRSSIRSESSSSSSVM